MADRTALLNRYLQLEYRLEYLREEFMWDRATSYRELAQRLREQADIVQAISDHDAEQVYGDTLCRFCDDYANTPAHNPASKTFAHEFAASEACRPRRTFTEANS